MNPTLRFSNRAEHYVQYRPSYPVGVVDILRRECGLAAACAIADIGSGTGLLAELFLRNGNFVYGVEPNRAMREAGERRLKDYPAFRSVVGSAESTTLPDGSVHFVTAGQSFHWFDRAKAQVEFRRILKIGGWIVVGWNERRKNATPFLEAYEQLLRTYSVDYEDVEAKYPTAANIGSFLETSDVILRTLDNFQELDLEGLKGRLLSSSYVPAERHPNFPSMLKSLEALFAEFQVQGKVILEYDTVIYCGQFKMRDGK